MELTISPFLFFDPQGDAKRQRRSSRQPDNAADREQRLFCVHCGNTITRQNQQIAVNGAHAHTCTNPHGLRFRIGCFRDAPGCIAIGAGTTEDTWFPGYAWRIADCARCGVHLGWLFTSSADGFYGLIVDRLRSASNA
jgi:hypothetical protein